MKVRVPVPIGSLCLKIITRVLDNVTIISITAVRVTITHEMANTKAVLQAILVQILTPSILPNPNSIYRDIDWCPKVVFVNTPSESPPNHFPNSQFPKRPQPIWLSTIWEIWKLGNGWRYILPNFPISQKTPAQMGQHDLGNWEIAGGTDFPISQFPKRSQPIWLSTIWEIGKLGNLSRYVLPNFPISQKISAHLAQHDLGNWEIGKPKP